MMGKVADALVDLMGCLAVSGSIDPETQQDILIIRSRLDDFGSLDICDPRPQSDHKEGDGVEWEPGVDLPPVDEVCEVYLEFKGWRKCEIIAHFEQPAGMVAAFTVGETVSGKSVDFYGPTCFRPIQPRRDKVIEAAMQVDVFKNDGVFTESPIFAV